MPDDAVWAEYRAGIKPFPTDRLLPRRLSRVAARRCRRLLRRAGGRRTRSATAQLVLKGNILIGVYEQWRVDSFFEVALDFNPGVLVKDLRIGRHDEFAAPVGIRHVGTRRGPSPSVGAVRLDGRRLRRVPHARGAHLGRTPLTKKPTSLRLGWIFPRADSPSRRRITS